MKYTSLLPPLFSLLLLCTISNTYSQNVIAADGGEGRTEKISIAWTLGEFAISTLTTPRGLLTEGFHQPGLQISRWPREPVALASAAGQGLQIGLAPNPVKEILTIRLQRKEDLSVLLRLLDANGSLLLQKEVLAPQQLELDFSTYPSGVYLLQFQQKDGLSLDTYKISKH